MNIDDGIKKETDLEIVEGEIVEEPSWHPQDADKEERKWITRQRVRNASVPEGTIFKHAKPKPSIGDPGEKTVAVYARVSTKSEEQVSSIENQTKYYKDKIAKTPNWNMQEIYADEGKSGTSMKKRTAFKQMIQDALAEKMDIILCASVSRFARNMTDCMEQISTLKTANPSHPVGVYFETENIFTLDPDSNQALSIHAMLADWESDNKSRRMILSYDQRIELGMFPVSDLLGYRHTKDGELIIQEDEALTVRFIFLARIYGYSYDEIAEILTERERPTLTGRTDWNGGMVSNILNNERRWGDLDVRKTIVLDYKKGKVIKNDGMRDAAFVPNHHEGIVTREIAKAAHAVGSSRNVKGVPDMKVIDNGALKGFVCLHPGFAGIDHSTLIELSKSAYTEEEYEFLEHEARIINGQEHSNILSMDFTGYYVPYSAYFIGRDTPTLSVTTKQIKLNRKCLEQFSSSHVELLYHPLLQAILIRDCDVDNGFEIRKEDGSLCMNQSAPSFGKALYEEMDWIVKYGFRFRGVARKRGNHTAVMFYLDEPQIIANKATKLAGEALSAEQKNMPSRYIAYKNSEISVGEVELEEIRKRRAGMLYGMRKNRDGIMNSISEADLDEFGTVVINPLIGNIPSHIEVEQELEEILLSM